jgi:hypothetical protein
MQINSIKQGDKQFAKETAYAFSSNHIRLSSIEWIVTLVIILLFVLLSPLIWAKAQHLVYKVDCRLPYKLGEDYWLYKQLSKVVCESKENIIIGDSVVWGQFVESGQTLSHYLTQFSGKKFANMGIDGLHPVAGWGLVKYYGEDIKNKNVYLHFNFLWISSPKNDLQTDKEFDFNHSGLVPQYYRRIPCYYTPFSKRLQAVLTRDSDFLSWVKHLQMLCLQNGDTDVSFPKWFVSHPYQNPFKNATEKLNSLFAEAGKAKQDVQKAETRKTDLPFVEIGKSLQWKYFMQTVDILQKRGNKVFVIVGPFNEHILNQTSLDLLAKIKADTEKSLIDKKINYIIAPVLPEEYFADASHPTTAGYEMLAKEIVTKLKENK